MLFCSTTFAVDVSCEWLICKETFIRGDANQDGSVNISDSITIYNYLYQGGPEPCLEAADADGDGEVLQNDGVYITDYLYHAGPPPPSPFPSAGPTPCHCSHDETNGCNACVLVADLNEDGYITNSGQYINGVFCSACAGDRELLLILLTSDTRPNCIEPADIDGDLDVDVDDLEILDNYLFGGGPDPSYYKTACWYDSPFPPPLPCI